MTAGKNDNDERIKMTHHVVHFIPRGRALRARNVLCKLS